MSLPWHDPNKHPDTTRPRSALSPPTLLKFWVSKSPPRSHQRRLHCSCRVEALALTTPWAPTRWIGAYRNWRGRCATSVPSVESVVWRDMLLHTHLGLWPPYQRFQTSGRACNVCRWNIQCWYLPLSVSWRWKTMLLEFNSQNLPKPPSPASSKPRLSFSNILLPLK